MKKRNHKVEVSPENLEFLSKKYNVSKRSVYSALTFKTRSGLAKWIRSEAVIELGERISVKLSNEESIELLKRIDS